MAKRSGQIWALMLAAVICAPVIAFGEFTGPVTICFLGDTGAGLSTQIPWAKKTHQLCKDAGAEAIVHAGDLDYIPDPATWEAFINTEMGLDFPYFYVIGNHEADFPATLPVYQANLEARFNRLGIPWTGALSQQAAFDWRGIRLIMTRPGLPDPLDHAEESAAFIREHASASDSPWVISFFHRQMVMMNVGDKADATGWGVFEEGRKEGATTWTGHHHSYGRTHLLSSMEFQTIADSESPYTLAKGVSLTVQNGLGGAGAPARRPRLAQSFLPYWAYVIAPPDIGDVPQVWGVNVCTFGAAGDPRRADCYFKTTSDAVIDSWTMYSVRDDRTVPVIGASVSGPAGANGWYTGPVSVSWNVSDPESGIASSSGCDSAMLRGETSRTTMTCSATNGNGLTASQSVTIQIDASSVRFSGGVQGVGRGPKRGGISIVGRFTDGRTLDLGSSNLMVNITSLLNEVFGRGELVAGVPLTLVNPRNDATTARFETPPGVLPAGTVIIGRVSADTYNFRIQVTGADIANADLCPVTSLGTEFTIDDGANPPVDVFIVDQPWRCLKRGTLFEYLRAP